MRHMSILLWVIVAGRSLAGCCDCPVPPDDEPAPEPDVACQERAGCPDAGDDAGQEQP
jgi:hypothetical protein